MRAVCAVCCLRVDGVRVGGVGVCGIVCTCLCCVVLCVCGGVVLVFMGRVCLCVCLYICGSVNKGIYMCM